MSVWLVLRLGIVGWRTPAQVGHKSDQYPETTNLALVGRWLAELSFAGTFDWVAVVDRTASLKILAFMLKSPSLGGSICVK